ncbi:hypothetical protein RND81_01G069200 [Saponaria officinalis]|uniref:Retrovirus-related Pol polyprotein from transposon TNT 1-94-like beta-barrel domain-containing protein n=1 Tax=Saponaria officinalis TaxID=3572 RepID=A0AAW1N945_SAPOF
MVTNGENITDERDVQKIIRSLNGDFDNVVSAIEEAHDLSTLSIERLLGSLSAQERRMRQRGKSSNSEHALQSTTNITKHVGCHGGRGRGRGRERGGNNFSYRKYKNVDINSTRDHKRTSFVRRDKSKVQCHRSERDNVVEAEETLVLACREGPDAESGSIWYLDTGCNNHMTGNKELLSYLDESVQGEVSFGNKSKVLVKGKENINIQSKNGTNVTIADVYYVYLGYFGIY